MKVSEIVLGFAGNRNLLIDWGDSFKRCTVDSIPVSLMNREVIEMKEETHGEINEVCLYINM